MIIPFSSPRFDTGPFDPESGLTLTDTFSYQSTVSSDDVDVSQPAVFACDLIGLTTANGLIHEHGASASGSYIGFDGGAFYARCGSGGALPTNNSASGTSSAVSGDGTLVWAFEVGTLKVRVWWNAVLVVDETAVNSVSSWAGSDSGSYFDDSTNVVTGPSSSSATVTSASGLRYYSNQTV